MNSISIRLAIDIGSNKTKIRLGKIEFINGMRPKIHTLFEKVVPIPFGEDLLLSREKCLSNRIQEQALEAIKEAQEDIRKYNPEISLGFATEAIRRAVNGEEFTKKVEASTGIPIEIISEEKEGILSFLAAIHDLDLDTQKVICWDGGAGSTQITAFINNRFIVYHSPIGKIGMKKILLGVQQQDSGSPNPVTSEVESLAFIILKLFLRNIPLEIRSKVSEEDIIIIKKGGHPLVGKLNHFSKKDIEQSLKECLGLEDQQIQKLYNREGYSEEDPTYIISNLILAKGVMEELKINKVTYSGSSGGNTTGILLWPEYRNE